MSTWKIGHNPETRWVFVPGRAKPINAGSMACAIQIVTAVNTHDKLIEALRGLRDLCEQAGMPCGRANAILKDFPADGEVGK